MQALWNAIKTRFSGDSGLVIVGRQCYIGLDVGERRTRPFVNVNILSGETLDSFGQDVLNYRLLFECWSKLGTDEKSCQALMTAVHRVFDDWQYIDDSIEVEGFEPISQTGPILENGLFQGTIEYDVTIRAVAVVSPRPNT